MGFPLRYGKQGDNIRTEFKGWTVEGCVAWVSGDGDVLLVVPLLGSGQLLRSGGLHLVGRGGEVGFAIVTKRGWWNEGQHDEFGL